MGKFVKTMMDLGLVFILLAVFIRQLEAVYTSQYPECTRVPINSRVQCGEARFHNYDIAACLQQVSSGNLCCYDDQFDDIGIPQCYVAEQLPPAGFVPSTSGRNTQTTTLAPRTTTLIGFAPIGIQSTVATPPNQPGFIIPSIASTSAAPTVTFAPTSDLLGNTIPQGPVSNIFPGGTESPEQALENLLVSLGISTSTTGPASSGTSVPGLPGPTQSLEGINRTVALCTSINNGLIPESIRPIFADVLSQCDTINTTISPSQANAFLQREIQTILQNNGQGGASVPTTARPVSNNFQNLLESISGNGGSSPNINPAGGANINNLILNALTGTTTAAPTTVNPFQALLGGSGSNTNPFQSLLGNNNGGGSSTSSLLTSLLANNNNGGGSSTSSLLTSLLGNSNNGGGSSTSSLLTSLLGNSNNGGGSSTSSLISSLLGNSNNGGGSSTSSLISSLLGNSGGSSSSSSSLTSLLLNSLTQQQRPTVSSVNLQNVPVGAQLPDFIGTTAAPVYNPIVCNLLLGNNGLLSSLTNGGGTLNSLLLYPYRQSLLQQYGCLNNLNNPLLLLQGGGGLDSLRETLGPLLGLTTSTGDETVGNELTGPLDPALIPPAALTQCLTERATLNAQYNCKVGIHVNILTEQECYNIGCVYAPGGMCFRCPHIPVSAQVNQLAQPTCSVATADRTDCPGFQQTYLLSTIFNQQQTFGSRSATSDNTAVAPRSRVGDGGNSSSTEPATRQGIFGNLGGLGGLGGLTGLGGGSSFSNQLLQRNCESRDCCWDASSTFINPLSSCYARANPTLPENSVDCLSSLTCGTTTSSFLARIIGGETVPSNTDRPWQALIRLRDSDLVRCSGAIVCSQWIVTAASCLNRISSLYTLLGFALELSPSSLEVFVGTNTFSVSAASALAVDQLIPHPLYVVTQNIHNIALIRVPTLQTSLTIAPVCLPAFASTSIETNNVTFYVDGFGEASPTVPQTNLKEIVATTYDIDLCRNIYQSSLPNTDVFCGLPVNPGEDTCSGDGGAPALTFDSTANTFTLVGISIGGSADCNGNQPMVFLEIASYREWIRQTTNGCCSIISTRLG